MFNGKQPSARLIGGALVGVMIFGTALGAEAATKKKPVKHTRTVTLAYRGGCTAEVNVGGNSGAGSPGACSTLGAANYALTARAGEKYVSISVADASGRQVPGQFWEKGSGTGNDTEIAFCGAMKNYRFPADGSILLDLDAVGAVATCPGVATQGTIKLVFSNLP